MDTVSAFLLLLSIALSSGRNLLSKNISDTVFGERRFFIYQTAIFSSGAFILLLANIGKGGAVSSVTLFYSICYALLLLSAQWCYTVALKNIDVSVCATVYSLGFIFPTISGMLFWSEPVSLFKIVGIIIVIPTIILAGTVSKNANIKHGSPEFIVFLIIAMLASGGLGIVQKLQQKSMYTDQKNAFVFIAFLIASAFSFICAMTFKTNNEGIKIPKLTFASGVGVCFAVCNLLNTILAGRLESAIFFPTLNIGNILLSLVLSSILFKERFTKKHFLILLLGMTSILLISL